MAIGYNRLGSNGRLGNQMFQYAGLRGIAAHKGYNWVIPPFDGYGGLCKTLNVLIDFENYMIIDLPEVNQLSKKYLSNFKNLKDKTSQSFYDEIASVEGIDLLISNYAYSECTFDLQKSYYDNIIVNADKFYITYNNISTKNMSSDYFIENASKDFQIKVEEEVRKCHTNFVLYGTKIKID